MMRTQEGFHRPAKAAAIGVARPRWVFFALPFRQSVLYDISDFVANVIESSHHFVGNSAEYTRTVAARLSASRRRSVQILHRTRSGCRSESQLGWLKVTAIAEKDQCNTCIIIWLKTAPQHPGENLNWMWGRSEMGNSSATEIEKAINETEEG